MKRAARFPATHCMLWLAGFEVNLTGLPLQQQEMIVSQALQD